MRSVPSAPGIGNDGKSVAERIATSGQQVLPPGFYPPYGSRYWMISSNQAIGPGPVRTQFSANSPTFTLPVGSTGYVTELLFIVNNLLITSDIVFRLLFNGGAVSGFDAIRMPQAGLAIYSFIPERVYQPVPDGATIAIDVLVTDAVTYNLSVMARGHFYDASFDERWKGLAG